MSGTRRRSSRQQKQEEAPLSEGQEQSSRRPQGKKSNKKSRNAAPTDDTEMTKDQKAFHRFHEQVYDAVAAELEDDEEQTEGLKRSSEEKEASIEEEILNKWNELERPEQLEYLADDEKDEEDDEEFDDEDAVQGDASGGKKSPVKSKAWREKLAKQRREREARYAELDKQIQELRQQQAENQRRRVEHLLGQSDVFQKFIDTSKAFHAGKGSPSRGQQQQRKEQAPMSPGGSKRRENPSADDEVVEDDEDETSSASSAKESQSASKSKKKGRKPKNDGEEGMMTNTVRLTKQPTLIQGEMRDYQIEGLNWMIQLQENGINGILADEMGLGKTLQTIALLAYNAEYDNVHGPHLILVPKTTLSNWMNEFEMWCPSLRALCFHGTKEERREIIKKKLAPGQTKREWDVVVTTYEMAIIESATFRRWPWQYLIIDEAHRIKNEKSALASTVRTYAVAHRLLLTGTPLQNNLHELWALLNFLLPDIFGDSAVFDEWFDMANDDNNAKTQMIQQLHRLLRPFMLRRLKSDVAKNLPPKKEVFLYVGLNSLQKEVYRSILKRDVNSVLYPGSDGQSSKARLLNIVMQLRKVCAHPYLFPGVEDRSLDPLGDHVIQASSKLSLLDRLLKKLRQKGSRVLIFSQMTRLLDILEDYCHIRNYEYSRIDGQTNYEDREDAIESFNRPDSSKFVFLLSTRAGGLGINLATADTVVLFDSDWNPQVDLQAQDRAHRIGQKKPVTVFRLITEDTIEEKIVERAMVKLKLDAVVVQQGRLANKHNRLSKDEMLTMIQYGADSVFRKDADESSENKSTEYSDADIQKILEEGEQKTQEVQKKAEALGKAKAAEMGMNASEDNASLLDFKMNAQTDSHVFEGVDYRKERTQKEIDAARFQKLKQEKEEEYAMSKRERKRVKSYNENVLFGGKDKSSNSAVNWSDLTAARRRTAQVLPKSHRLPKLENYQFLDAFRLIEIARELVKHVESKRSEIRQAAEDVSDFLNREMPDLVEEQKQLLSEGFPAWKKKDFRSFVESCCTYGRHNVDDIVREVSNVTGHSEDEVERYFNCFWYGVNESRRLSSQRINSILSVSDEDYSSESDWPVGYGRRLEQFPQILNAVRRAETRGRDIRRMHGAVCYRMTMTHPPLPGNSLIEHECVSPNLCDKMQSFDHHLVNNNVAEFALNLEAECSEQEKKKKKSQQQQQDDADMALRKELTPTNRPPWTSDISTFRPNPWETLYWKYDGRKSNMYTVEHDRYLASLVAKYGHGHWRKFRKEILSDPQWKFDFFFRSRSTQELARRTEIIMRCIERDTKDVMESVREEAKSRKTAIETFYAELQKENSWMEKEKSLCKKWDKLFDEAYRSCRESDLDNLEDTCPSSKQPSKAKVPRDRLKTLKEQADKKQAQMKQLIEKCPEKGFNPAFFPQLAKFVEGLKKTKNTEMRCNKNLIAEEFISGAQKRSESARQKANKSTTGDQEQTSQPGGATNEKSTEPSTKESSKKAPSDSLTITGVSLALKMIARLSDEKPSGSTSTNTESPTSTNDAPSEKEGSSSQQRTYVLKKDYQWLLGATRKHVQDAKNALAKDMQQDESRKSKDSSAVINMRGSVNPLDKLTEGDKHTLADIVRNAGEANKEDLVSRFIQQREKETGVCRLTRNLVNTSLSVVAIREGRTWRLKSPQERQEYINSLYQKRREKEAHGTQTTLEGVLKRPRDDINNLTVEGASASSTLTTSAATFHLFKPTEALSTTSSHPVAVTSYHNVPTIPQPGLKHQKTWKHQSPGSAQGNHVPSDQGHGHEHQGHTHEGQEHHQGHEHQT